MLEIGLIKLAEMKRLASIESILERLDSIANSAATPAAEPEPKPRAAAATEEKKTLVETRTAAAAAAAGGDVINVAIPPSLEAPVFELSILKTPRVKLAPIPSEDLLHIEDTWLDAEYEYRLLREGDDLKPIPGASDLIKMAFGADVEPSPPNGTNKPSAELNIESYLPKYEEPLETPLPKLSDDPTEEELVAFANAHPIIRHAIRRFRAKIVEIKKVGP
jgi:hypothetical protein